MLFEPLGGMSKVKNFGGEYRVSAYISELLTTGRATVYVCIYV